MAVTKKDRALERFKAKLTHRAELEKKIDTLMRKHGITDMQAEVETIKKETAAFAVENGISRVDLEGFHYTLIEQHYGSFFVGTRDDLADVAADYDREIVPLRTIIYRLFPRAKAKEIWLRVTKRIPDPDKIESAVAEGLFTVDEIAPSFVEKKKSAYLRRYDD